MHVTVSLTIEVDASTGIVQMEEQIQQAGHQWMCQALKQAVRQWEEHHRVCEACQHPMRSEGTVARTIQMLFGTVRLLRRRFRCQNCHQRICPANELLKPLAQTQISAPLRDAAVLVGASWPYRMAAQVLSRLSGAQISSEAIRQVTNEQGKQRARHQEQTTECISAKKPEQNHLPDRQASLCVIGLDGGWVCSREQVGGMEGKVGVIASNQQWGPKPALAPETMTWYERKKHRQTRRHPARQRSRWATRRYVASFADAATFAKQAAQAVDDLGCSSSPQVVVADGAAWIKQQTATHFAQAVHILDWPHLWRTICKAVRAIAREHHHVPGWLHNAFKRLGQWLWKGQVEPACAWLDQWKQASSPITALETAIRYLHNQRDWIGSYEQWKRDGYPVGSGIVERAVALVINRRMKKRGMRWLRANATAIVALRVDLLNQDWDRAPAIRSFP